MNVYQIKASCSGCHACELSCPVGAIYYDGPRYQIDPEKCISCGTCERVCPTCSVYDTEAVPTAASHEPVHISCDVAVCGGGAGLVTAVKAAQAGKKVVLLEKAKIVGGDMNLAHAFFPVYSKVHAQQGIADLREEAVRELCARAGGEIPEALMRTAVYSCVDFMDWLLEFPGTREHFPLHLVGEKRFQGPVFGPAIFGFPKRIENCDSKDPSIGPGWMGTFVRNAMLEAIERETLDVTILTETAAEHLCTDDTGAVTGVIARDPGGEVHVAAKAVVLVTGGYGASREKMDKYFGFYAVERPVTEFTIPSNTGDAIDMLQELGVEPDPERMFVSVFGPAHHPYSYSLYRLLDHPSTLAVNLNGDRVFDESGGLHAAPSQIVGSPKQVMWGIYTQKNIDDIMDEYLHDPTLSEEYDCYACYQADLDKEAAYKVPPVAKADTLEELAGKMGMPAVALQETVARYNGFCSEGVDREKGKAAEHLRAREEGPWYGVYGQVFSECAAGGVTVDENCRVLRNDASVIPGLYAAGNATSAMHRRGKLAVVSELTWAVASAYRAAEEIIG